MTTWGKILGLSIATMFKYRRSGKLKAKKQLNGLFIITKRDVCECFHIEQQATAGAKRCTMIEKLRNMTVANGCTKAEAATAKRK